ncbi:MAG: histidine kinase [Nocardioidaceae bacterium]
MAAAALALVWFRRQPVLVAVVGLSLLLVSARIADTDDALGLVELAVAAAHLALLAANCRGRRAVFGAVGAMGWLVALYLVTADRTIGLAMFTVPAYLAGMVLRMRQDTADELEARGRELEHERELFAQLALQHERARIASELHDIVGHAISVMVVQAAAGQRLVDTDPERAKDAFAAIAESARQGKRDLERLIELLGGTQVETPDLSLIDEVVRRAAGSGLDVVCRFEGDRGGVSAGAAHLAFRVVQEGLTNALRHAPGAAVQVLVAARGRDLTVRVHNSPPRQTHDRPRIVGLGAGLLGLRERVTEAGGELTSGRAVDGGWELSAVLPAAAC